MNRAALPIEPHRIAAEPDALQAEVNALQRLQPAERCFPAIFMRHDVRELLDEKSVQMVTITAEG
jgi:hypothetical protein